MAYTINKTDGTIVATIADGTIDTSTSLTLFGQNYSGFGELLNENLVKLLENSSSTSSPTAPIKGELWFDNNTAHNLSQQVVPRQVPASLPILLLEIFGWIQQMIKCLFTQVIQEATRSMTSGNC